MHIKTPPFNWISFDHSSMRRAKYCIQMMRVAPSPVSHRFHHARTANSAVTILPPMRALRRCSVAIAHHLLSTILLGWWGENASQQIKYTC
jgi:hypothetical protein